MLSADNTGIPAFKRIKKQAHGSQKQLLRLKNKSLHIYIIVSGMLKPAKIREKKMIFLI